MADQSLAVQIGIKSALSASAAVQALVGARVYDRVPVAPTYPYVTIGEGSTTDDGAECNEGEEVVFNISVYSRGTSAGGFGMTEARRIAAAIKAALHEQDIALTDAAVHLVDLRFRDATFRLEPDGETRRGILQYVALTEPTAP